MSRRNLFSTNTRDHHHHNNDDDAQRTRQGFWIATQEQLKYLQRQCQYLRYTGLSSIPFVEKYSGSLEMFSPPCHNTKVSFGPRESSLSGDGMAGERRIV